MAFLFSLLSLHCWNTKSTSIIFIFSLRGYYCGGTTELYNLDVSSCASSIRKTNVLKMLLRERRRFMARRHILPRHENCRVS